MRYVILSCLSIAGYLFWFFLGAKNNKLQRKINYLQDTINSRKKEKKFKDQLQNDYNTLKQLNKKVKTNSKKEIKNDEDNNGSFFNTYV